MRDLIPENIKLAAIIRFLATSDNYTNLQYQFRVYASTLSKFIPEVCDAMYKFEKVNSSFFPSRIHKYKYSKSCFHSFMF